MTKAKAVFFSILLSILLLAIIGLSIFFGATPTGKTLWNNWFHAVQKADDNTRYENRKAVEDTCRAMMASYKSDALTYEQYNGSTSAERQSWADQAKMRANKTAAEYNEFVLKNSYIWNSNIPADIEANLPYLN